MPKIWPTSTSREKKLIDQAEQVDRVLRDLRTTSSEFKSRLQSENVPIEDIVTGIFDPFVVSRNRLLTLVEDRDILIVVARNIGIGAEFEPSDVDVTNDRFLGTDPQYRDNDQIRINPVGLSDLPAPFQSRTTYYVVGRDENGFSLSESEGGVAVDIVDSGSGQFTLDARLNSAASGVNSALNAVINTIDNGVPTSANGRVESYSLDDTGGADGETAIVYDELSPSQTTQLQNDLQGVIDAIEAPAV